MTNYTLKFPPGAPIATIGDKWHREEDGSVVATYTREELELCMKTLEVSENTQGTIEEREGSIMALLSGQKGVVQQAMDRFGAKVDRSGFE